jgi:hypothetical protein
MLAQGQYRSMTYNLTEYDYGTSETDCVVYIHGHDHASGPTWKEAIDKMRESIVGESVTEPDMSEAPA